MAVYLDIAILLNFAVDFLLLLSVNRLTGYPSSVGRCLAGSAIGGLYGGVCLLPGFGFLGGWIYCVICLGGISVVAFGCNPSAARRGTLFVLLSFALSGAVVGLEKNNVITVLLAGTGLYFACKVGFGNHTNGSKYVKVVLTWKGCEYPLLALTDTGNTLKDPITGTQVLVVGPQIAERLLQLTRPQLLDPIGTMQTVKIPGLRLLPYRGVGKQGGLLLGLRIDGIKIDGQTSGRIIAFSPENIGNGDAYQALAGGTI